MGGSRKLVAEAFIFVNDTVLLTRSEDEYVFRLPHTIVPDSKDPAQCIVDSIKREFGIFAVDPQPFETYVQQTPSGSELHIVYFMRFMGATHTGEATSATWFALSDVRSMKLLGHVSESIFKGYEYTTYMHGGGLKAGAEVANITLPQAIPRIRSGQIGVIPTDTLYGIVGSVYHFETIERMYDVKGRESKKPFIILLSEIDELSLFGVRLTDEIKKITAEYWPGPVTIIIPCMGDSYRYLHRGGRSLAFRIPDDLKLRAFLHDTGPIAAPSANPEGKDTAKTTTEAMGYFEDAVDFYVDGGTLEGEPSTLIRLDETSKIEVLRQGKVAIK